MLNLFLLIDHNLLLLHKTFYGTHTTVILHSENALPLKFREVFVLVNKYDLLPPCFKCNLHMFMPMLPYVLLATCLIAVPHCEIFLKMLGYCQLSDLQ